MFRTADIGSVNEFWDAALKSLKAYIEAAGHDSEVVIQGRPNCKVLNGQNADPTVQNDEPE